MLGHWNPRLSFLCLWQRVIVEEANWLSAWLHLESRSVSFFPLSWWGLPDWLQEPRPVRPLRGTGQTGSCQIQSSTVRQNLHPHAQFAPGIGNQKIQNAGRPAKLKHSRFLIYLFFLDHWKDMFLLVHCISLCSMLSLASFRYSRLSAAKYRNWETELWTM